MYKIMPRNYREKIGELLRLSGSKISPQMFINYSFSFSFAIGFVVALFLKEYLIFIWLGVFICTFFLFHGFLLLAIEKRASYVETVLPDALQLMSANLKAGFIPSQALFLSSRPEFGPLSDAIKKSGKEIMTGKSLEEGLKEIPKYIKSKVLETTIHLISEGVKAGGELVSLLEENAANLRRTESIRKEIKANILTYTIFIFFAGCLGAPVLYALSSFLLQTIQGFGGSVQMPESRVGGISLFQMSLSVSPEFLFYFSLTAIILTTTFSGLIIGLIQTGKETSGIKYIPVLVTIALLVFLGAKILITSTFGAMFPT